MVMGVRQLNQLLALVVTVASFTVSYYFSIGRK